MPFARVRAPDAVQYQDVCTGITGAIGTSYSVIGGTMIIPKPTRLHHAHQTRALYWHGFVESGTRVMMTLQRRSDTFSVPVH